MMKQSYWYVDREVYTEKYFTFLRVNSLYNLLYSTFIVLLKYTEKDNISYHFVKIQKRFKNTQENTKVFIKHEKTLSRQKRPNVIHLYSKTSSKIHNKVVRVFSHIKVRPIRNYILCYRLYSFIKTVINNFCYFTGVLKVFLWYIYNWKRQGEWLQNIKILYFKFANFYMCHYFAHCDNDVISRLYFNESQFLIC